MTLTTIYRITFDPTKDYKELKEFEANKTDDWVQVAYSTTGIVYEQRHDITEVKE